MLIVSMRAMYISGYVSQIHLDALNIIMSLKSCERDAHVHSVVCIMRCATIFASSIYHVDNKIKYKIWKAYNNI